MDDDSPFRRYTVPRIVSRNARKMWVSGLGEMDREAALEMAEYIDDAQFLMESEPETAAKWLECVHLLATCSEADRDRLVAALETNTPEEALQARLDRVLELARTLNMEKS